MEGGDENAFSSKQRVYTLFLSGSLQDMLCNEEMPSGCSFLLKTFEYFGWSENVQVTNSLRLIHLHRKVRIKIEEDMLAKTLLVL